MPFDAISYILAKKSLQRAIRAEMLPTLKDLVIDADKDWNGHSITNLDELHCIAVLASSLVRAGDLEFKNGWRLSEHDQYGIILISPCGKKYRLRVEEIGAPEAKEEDR